MSTTGLSGLPSRRTVIKSAVAAGAVGVWAVPVVSTFPMSRATADTVSGPPTPPSFSIDPTEITAPPDPTGGSTATATATATRSASAADAVPAAAAPAVAAKGELAATGVTLPVGATTAVAAGAIAAGVAAVVLGNRTSAATADGSADVVDVPRGPRRH